MDNNSQIPSIGASEAQEIAAYLATYFKNAKVVPEFRDILVKWASFVTQCEIGYSDYLDEYLNDLSCRAIIENIIHNVGAKTADGIRVRTNPLDRRFELATTLTEKNMVQNQEPLTEFEKRLYSRLPLKIGGDFEVDINALRGK